MFSAVSRSTEIHSHFCTARNKKYSEFRENVADNFVNFTKRFELLQQLQNCNTTNRKFDKRFEIIRKFLRTFSSVSSLHSSHNLGSHFKLSNVQLSFSKFQEIPCYSCQKKMNRSHIHSVVIRTDGRPNPFLSRTFRKIDLLRVSGSVTLSRSRAKLIVPKSHTK